MAEVNDRPALHAAPSLGRDALWVVSVAIVYFVTARLSQLLEFEPEDIAAICPPTSIFLSAILLSRRSVRPILVAILFATDLFAGILSGTPFLSAALYSLAVAGDAVLGAVLLLRYVGEHLTFSKVRHVLCFVVLAVVLSNFFTSLVAAAGAALIPGTDFWDSWKWWAASDGIANLLLTPCILSWAYWIRSGAAIRNAKRTVECAALFSCMAMLNLAAFHYLSEAVLFPLVLSYVTIPFLLWTAFRFGVRGVTSALLILATIAIPYVMAGHVVGFSSHDSPEDAAIFFQLYLALMILPSLFLAAVVAEREQASEVMLESEERYRTLFEGAGQGIAVADVTTKAIRYVNSSVCQMFGYTRAEMIQLTLEDLHPEKRIDDDVVAFENLVFDEKVFAHDVSCRRKDGSVFYADTYARPVVLAGRRMSVAFYADTTERKRAEEERDNLRAQLLHAQKMESVGRLAGGVAHDFNNMLQAILGNIELALERTDPEGGSRENLDEAQRAALRSADLVQQLLAFARKQTVAPKVLDLNATIEGMLPMLRRLIGYDVDLAWVPGADLWPVKMDPTQIDQILANLSVNARDAIGGVGWVTIETRNVVYDEHHATGDERLVPGAYVLFAVSDNGRGMEKEIQAHLFEPFFTTKGMGEGTGLGLSTVYGIVKQNKGFINVYSEPGHGTSFKIYLPRFESAE